MTEPVKFRVDMVEGPGAERGRYFESVADTAYNAVESAAWKFDNDDALNHIWESFTVKVTTWEVEPYESKDWMIHPAE